MLSTLIFNFLASLMVLSVSGTLIVHDTRLVKAFVSTVVPVSQTTVREFGHSVMTEQHVHNNSSHSMLSNASASDASVRTRSHRKHTALPHNRMRLSMLTA